MTPTQSNTSTNALVPPVRLSLTPEKIGGTPFGDVAPEDLATPSLLPDESPSIASALPPSFPRMTSPFPYDTESENGSPSPMVGSGSDFSQSIPKMNETPIAIKPNPAVLITLGSNSNSSTNNNSSSIISSNSKPSNIISQFNKGVVARNLLIAYFTIMRVSELLSLETSISYQALRL